MRVAGQDDGLRVANPSEDEFAGIGDTGEGDARVGGGLQFGHEGGRVGHEGDRVMRVTPPWMVMTSTSADAEASRLRRALRHEQRRTENVAGRFAEAVEEARIVRQRLGEEQLRTQRMREQLKEAGEALGSATTTMGQCICCVSSAPGEFWGSCAHMVACTGCASKLRWCPARRYVIGGSATCSE